MTGTLTPVAQEFTPMTVVRLPPVDATPTDPRPKVLHASRRNAPKKAPCPHCGQLGRRKNFHQRTVRSIAYQAILLLEVTTAEYRATCDCCTTFRTQIEGVEPKAHYDNKVRQAVLDRLLDDRMTVQQIQHALHRDFFLDLSTGFLYDCLDWQIRQVDGAVYRQWTLAHFSGTLCIDEIHLGEHTLLLATDPLHDFPVAFALVSHNDQAHMGRFLRQLQAHGFRPQVVVTDGSSLYPALLAEIWPQAEHQLCVFHVLKDINEQVLDAVRRIRREMRRRGQRGRKRKPGRPKKGSRRQQRQRTLRDKADFVYKHRYLIVKRPEKLTAQQQKDLVQMLADAPSLRPLQAFVAEVYRLFERSQTEATAWRRHAALVGNGAYALVAELATALQLLAAEKFTKMIAFLRSRVGQRVRTNNHVERMNRVLRLYEKTRYKWRSARTKVRFVWLLVDRRWGAMARTWAKQPGGGAGKATREESQPNLSTTDAAQGEQQRAA
jgi:transposase